jgi:competence protein ComEC
VSIVVKYGDISFLLTGDLPELEESKLISDLLPRHVTVYKAGHHGSKYSSSEQLLTYIRPEYTVISAGKNNTYGHPSPEAISRLQRYSREIISTIDRGTITFVTDGKSMKVETKR